MKNFFLLILCSFCIGFNGFSQNRIQSIVDNHLKNNATKAARKAEDVKEYKITSVVPSLNPNIEHVYLQQYYQGIPIQFATYKLTVTKDDKVTYVVDQFFSGTKANLKTKNAAMTSESAVKRVITNHNLPTPRLQTSTNSNARKLQYADTGMSLQPITAEQVYVVKNGALVLTWKVGVYQQDGEHWWVENVDAITGKIVHSEDWVIQCHFDTGHT